jgi:hypothetical protein
VLTALGLALVSRLVTEAMGMPCLGTNPAPADSTGQFALPGLL